EFSNMSFKLYETNDPDQKAIENFTVDLASPETEYKFDNGLRVDIDKYYPNYYHDEDYGEPRSESNDPWHPAFVFKVYSPDNERPEISFAGLGRNIDTTGENQYKLGITDFETHDVSGLSVRRDYTLPLFGLGALIFMVGVVQGLYWQHRRIWVHPKGEGILLAAHTNKNWFGIKKDI